MAIRDPDSFADRITELEHWREHEVAPALRELRDVIDDRRVASRVADELRRRGVTPERTATLTADKIEERGGLTPTRISLTWYQRAGAFVAGAVILADAVRGLLS